MKEEEKQTVKQIPEEKQEIETAEKSAFMPTKTFVLIASLILITIALLFFAFYNSPQNNKKPPAETLEKTLQTGLNIATPVFSSPGYTAQVQLSTERKKVTVVKIELAYDPKILTNVDIKPGPFFPSPTILNKTVDKVNGKISFILGIGLGQSPVNGNGTVAILSFTPIPESGTATIDFAPESDVTVADQLSSILTSTRGIQFTFGPTPTP